MAISNFVGAALDQQAALVDLRIAESTRRQTELMAARAGANFGALASVLNIPGASFDPGAFLNLQPLNFGALNPASAQLFSTGMLGVFNQLSTNWAGLLGGSSLGGFPSSGVPGLPPMGGGAGQPRCH